MNRPLNRRSSFTEVIRGVQAGQYDTWVSANRVRLFSGAHQSYWVNRLRQQGFDFAGGTDAGMQFRHRGDRSTVEVAPARLVLVHPDLRERYRGPIEDVPEMDEDQRSWDGIQTHLQIIRYLGNRADFDEHAGEMLEWFFGQANIMHAEGRVKNRRARAFLSYAGFGFNGGSFAEYDPEHVLPEWRPAPRG